MSNEKNGEEKTNIQANILGICSNILDSNVRLARYAFYALGATGLVIIFKSSGLAHLVTRSSDIPSSFIKRRVKLRGYVNGIGTKGSIYVQHRPFLNIVPKKWRQQGDLSLVLASVELTPQGSKWLQEKLLHKTVWFQPLFIENDRIISNIFTRKYLRFQSVNKILVSEGFCQVLHPQSDLESKPHKDLYYSLMYYQKEAVRKRKGMWTEKKQDKSTESSYLRNLISLPKKLFTNIFKKFWR